MSDTVFDHEKLDVYRLSVEYVSVSFRIAKELTGLHRHARDQWLRAAQSIPPNMAEGNGKRSRKDRNRFLDVARGSALECASVQDVLLACNGIDTTTHHAGKRQLKRIVSMLTKLLARSDRVTETSAPYHVPVEYEYEYEYRCAEYEHETDNGAT